jgi:hypothetical protein
VVPAKPGHHATPPSNPAPPLARCLSMCGPPRTVHKLRSVRLTFTGMRLPSVQGQVIIGRDRKVYSVHFREQEFAREECSVCIRRWRITVLLGSTPGRTCDLIECLSDVRFLTGVCCHKSCHNTEGAIVEMFGWPHEAVAQECPSLAKAGYLGVKLFPPQEQVMSNEPYQNMLNPWYFMYQPVSYRLEGRMGSRDQLRTTIAACRKVGVRVYADAVVNHMYGARF